MNDSLYLIQPAKTKKEKNVEKLKCKLDDLDIEGKIDQNTYWHMMALINRIALDTSKCHERVTKIY